MSFRVSPQNEQVWAVVSDFQARQPTALPQYSQQPLASGMVLAPQLGQTTAVLGAFAAAISSRASCRTIMTASLISLPMATYC